MIVGGGLIGKTAKSVSSLGREGINMAATGTASTTEKGRRIVGTERQTLAKDLVKVNVILTRPGVRAWASWQRLLAAGLLLLLAWACWYRWDLSPTPGFASLSPLFGNTLSTSVCGRAMTCTLTPRRAARTTRSMITASW